MFALIHENYDLLLFSLLTCSTGGEKKVPQFAGLLKMELI